MTQKNDESEVFISYAWGENSPIGDERMQFVEDLQLAFKRRGITVLIDKDEVTYKKSIQNFMDRLSSGKYIIMVISDKYLKSKYCMYEALKILENEDYYDRIFPVVFKDAKIYEPIDILEYIQFWTEKIKELNEKILKVDELVYIKVIINELEQYFEIRRLLTKFTDIIADLNTLTPEKIRKNDFEVLFNSIKSTAPSQPIHQIKYSVDVAFCIDTHMTETNLELLKTIWLGNNIQLLKDKFSEKGKVVDTFRCKLIEINNPDGINTKFYDVNKSVDFSKFQTKRDALKVSDTPLQDLSLIRKAIQSDWSNLADKARFVIFVFSESTIAEPEFKDIESASRLWFENEFMGNAQKRLVLYVPDTDCWNSISNNWDNTVHYPANTINENVLRDYKNTDTILSTLISSI